MSFKNFDSKKNYIKTYQSYPTKDSLKKLQQKRKRNIIIISCIIFILIGVTILESKFVDQSSLAVFALFNLNVTLLLLLIVLITRNLIKIIMERKRDQTNSRFRNKLILAFVILSMVPSLMLAIIGSNMIADSIRNWFNPKVDKFIDDAMEIARLAHQANVQTLKHFGKSLSNLISSQKLLDDHTKTTLEDFLLSKQKEMNIDIIQLFDNKKEELFKNSLIKIPPSSEIKAESQILDNILSGKIETYSYTNLLGMGEIIQEGFPIYSSKKPHSIQGVIFLSIYLPKGLTQKIHFIKRNYEAYKQQKQAILPTQGLYISIFVLIAFTILFAAIWLGLYMARQISIPISHLAIATKEIARGNLNYRLEVLAYDEIGSLVQSFNWMIEQLNQNKSIIDKTTKELQQTYLEIMQQRNQLEAILLHIGSGIILLDKIGNITMINETAKQFLHLSPTDYIGKYFKDVFNLNHLKMFGSYIERLFQRKRKFFIRDIQLEYKKHVSILSVRFISLFNNDDDFNGLVIVIDDLTQQLRVQRIAAWQEVARRLAHEIKNPLTPIQLNAQRLKKKFLSKADDFPDILTSSLDVIINEVNSLRQMLDEFSKFARMPEAHLKPSDLNNIIIETCSLYSTNDSVILNLDLDSSLPSMLLDSNQMKRLFINLIDNALEAMKHKGKVEITTHYDPILNLVTIHIKDTGPGIPAENFNKLFLPYFTTKRRGSGLGLAICSRIVSDHEGTIKVKSRHPRGTIVTVELPVKTANEKRESN